MSFTRVMTANFGASKTGLATVGYTITGGSRITAGVTEIAAGSGSYKATVTFADAFDGTILWDTGGGSPVYASEAVNPVTATVASLPDPPPLGYGPIGTGSVAVNQDYPTDGNLTFRVTSSGPGIPGALIRAYLASEYSLNPNTATIRGQTTTLESGAWANNVNLDPGDYTLVFTANGYQDAYVELEVS